MSERVVAARRIAELIGDFDRTPAYQGLAEGLRVLITEGRVPVDADFPDPALPTHGPMVTLSGYSPTDQQLVFHPARH